MVLLGLGLIALFGWWTNKTGELEGVGSQYNSSDGIIQSKVKSKRFQSRAEELGYAKSELEAKTHLLEAPERLEREIEGERLAFQLAVDTNRLNTLLISEAEGSKLDVPALIEVNKKRLLDEQARIHEQRLAADEIRMTTIAEWLRDHQKMNEIQLLIDNALREIAELNRGFLRGEPIDESIIPRMISSREESIGAWEGNKRGLQQRLLEAHDREDVEAIGQATSYERDPEPELGADSL